MPNRHGWRTILHSALLVALVILMYGCDPGGASSSRTKPVEEMTPAEAREVLMKTRRRYGEVPFFLYMREGNVRMVKLHLRAGMDPNIVDKHRLLYGARNEPVLIYAVSSSRSEMALALIDAGADVNIRNRGGMTPLMYAAMRDNPEIVKTLIEAGADVNARVRGNMMVLIYAVLGGRIDAEDAFSGLLMDAVMGLSAELHGGGRTRRATPGSSGAEVRGSTECVKLLLEAGADIDAQTAHGETALMYAAHAGLFEKASVLLEYGADPSLKNMQGETALQIARKKGRTDIVELLRDAGAEK